MMPAEASDIVIADARVRILEAQVTDGTAMSFAPLSARTMVLVEIEAADGTVGHGESWANFPSWASVERVATLEKGLFPILRHRRVTSIAALNSDLRSELEALGRQWGAPGPIRQAISGVDIALWDLRGKLAGTSVSRLAGGRVRDDVHVYASSLGPNKVEEHAHGCSAAGFDAVKVKLGFGPDTDRDNLATVRAVCGPDIRLFADANQAWTFAEAVEMAPVLRDHGVEWVEEPIRGNRLEDLEAFHAATGLTIATGENLYGRTDFWGYVASKAIGVLQPDVTKTGGFSEAVAITHLAEAWGKQVIPHMYGGAIGLAATLQLAAVTHNIDLVEFDCRDNPLREQLPVDPLVQTNGRIPIPDDPGLGVKLSDSALTKYQARER